MSKKTIKTAIQILVSLLIILALLKSVDSRLFLLNVKDMRLFYFLLAILILPLNILIRVYRWQLIINSGSNRMGLADLYMITLAGVSLNTILPGSSGDIARSYYGYLKSGLKEEMLSSSILDQLLGLLGIFILGLISSIIYGLWLFACLSIVPVILLFLILMFPKMMPWKILAKVFSAVLGKQLDTNVLTSSFTLTNVRRVAVISLSILGWVVTCSLFYLVCRSFSVEVKLIYVYAAFPLVVLARMFPLTLNGLGSQEAAIMYLFRLDGAEMTSLAAIALFYRLVVLVIPAICGLPVILKLGLVRKRQIAENA
jgi:glycosyltransferase 2 family protein